MTQSVPEVTVTELKARLDADDAPTLVDVREAYERNIADLPEVGQLRIPTAEVAHRLDEVDKEAEVVVYCRSGSRSEWAVRLLMNEGYERVFNLKGGVLAWREEIDPTLQAY